MAVPAARATVRNSAGPLLWTAPAAVDNSPIDSIACPTTRLCVAVDRAGDVLWSTNPAGGSRTWHAANVDGRTELTGIACPSSGAVRGRRRRGQRGHRRRTRPADGRRGRSPRSIPARPRTTPTPRGRSFCAASSCPSTGLCVAVDGVGNALASTDPAGGATAWTITHADANRSYGCIGAGLTCQPPLVGVSCPSIARCAAVDFSGNVLTTQNPTAPGPWAQHADRRQSAQLAVGDLVSAYRLLCDGGRDGGPRDHVQPGRAHRAARARAARRAVRDLVPVASLCLASAQTRAGLSGLLGSYNPAARGIDLVAEQPRWRSMRSRARQPSMCVAADDQGDVAAGLTTHAISALLLSPSCSPARHLPTIAALDRTRRSEVRRSQPDRRAGHARVDGAGHDARTPR